MAARLVLAANSAQNLLNFRSGLIEALVARGFEVVAAAPPDARAEAALAALGCRFRAVPLDGAGVNPLRDARTLRAFRWLFVKERPDVFLGWTIKAVIYGSLAARISRVTAIPNISGLGTAFIERNWLTSVVVRLYRLAFARASAVFFQNEADRDLFLRKGMVRPDQVRLVPGSGVDLRRFAPAAARPGDGRTRFLLIGRVMTQKGVREYAEAARLLRAQRLDMQFSLAGGLGKERSAIHEDTLASWQREGLIDWAGAVPDIRPLIAESDCVVLPSYREGTSRALLEAAAMARPLVATDVPGCREVVDDGVNGYLCRPRDAADLARAMARVADDEPVRRAAMGEAGRDKVRREFDEQIVIGRYLQAIDEALAARP